MEELSIEEKAKAYDKVREKIKVRFGTNVAEEIFSEFEESEDEKIRKKIIALFKGQIPYTSKEDNEKFIAWLEKQKTSEEALQYLKDSEVSDFQAAIDWLKKQGHTDSIIEKAKTEKQRVIITETNGNANIDWDTRSLEDARRLLECGLQYINTELEKQGDRPQGKTYTFEGKSVLEAINKIGEKKFANKVKPKFKVGDWIVNNEDGSVGQITKIIHEVDDDGLYAYEHTNGYFHNAFEKDYHLWTIEDVKDGDVLCSEQIILLFKKWEYNSNWNCVIAYAGIDITGKLQITNKHWLISNYAHPATKEQRDLLFQKMHEAGYEWDVETKELKKIDNEIEIPFGAKDSELQEATYFIPKGFHAEIDADKVVIKKGEKPTDWSEEDKEMLEDVRDNFEYNKGEMTNSLIAQYDKFFDKIKFLKPQPKQKWSEEDIATISRVISIVKWAAYSDHSHPILNDEGATELVEQLNSIKDKCTWKPSNEQMNILFKYAEQNNKDGSILTSLYQDLKKLREE